MTDTTNFTKRDRQFIVKLARTIDEVKTDLANFKKECQSENKPVKKQKETVHKQEDAPTVRAEFYKTDNKTKQLEQYLFVESLEQMLREICEKHDIAFLSVEIDTREE